MFVTLAVGVPLLLSTPMRERIENGIGDHSPVFWWRSSARGGAKVDE
jgi:hypothetical protein